MKEIALNFKSRASLLAVVLLVFGNTLIARDIEKTKNYHYEFKCEPNAIVALYTSSANITIETWEKDEIIVDATLKMEAEEIEDIETLVRKADFQPLFKANEVRINKPFKVKKDITLQVFKKNRRITLEDGTKLKNINYEISYTIKMPERARLNLKNSYKDVKIGNLRGESFIELYSSDLKAGKLGKTHLSLKYGSAEIEETKEANVNLFEGRLEIGMTRDIKLNSRYSRINLNKADKLYGNSYEDRFEITRLDELELNAKYGTIKLGTLRHLQLNEAYELTVEASSVQTLAVGSSKYSNYDFETVAEAKFQSSYEDKFVVVEIDRLLSNPKYSRFEIDKLKKDLTINGYETNVSVGSIDPGVATIRVEGKYMNILLHRSMNLPVRVWADVKYASFYYNRKLFTVKREDEKAEKLQLEMESKNSNGQKGTGISIQGYEVKFTLKEI